GRGRKIINLSEGDQEIAMLRAIRDSGWKGPVGILNHRDHLDAEVGLRDNLIGLQWVLRELAQTGSGGEKPKLESALPVRTKAARQGSRLVAGKFGKALDAGDGGGLLLPGKDEWRSGPITVEAWAKLRSAKNFNVIVASDTKASSAHWEIYSFAGAGDFSVFLPGQGGGLRTGVNICDDAWHHLAMVLEKDRVRLFVDGKLAKEQALPARNGGPLPAELGIGRTVEDGIGCDGSIDDVRISRGVREITSAPVAALTRDDATLGLWPLDELPKTATATLPEREPLDAAAHPLHTHPINRDRIYDFYAKQARDFAASAEKPNLLPAFPGLDSGRSGHWGNQTEANWNNARWNEMDPGSMQAAIFRHADRTVARAVCVRLEDAAVCFDPDTLTWPEAWRGGFVRFGTARFGFLGGVSPVGKSIAAPKGEPARPGSFTYRGFYRNGAQVVFSYQRDGVEWLESASHEVGSVVVTRERAGEGKLSALTRGGAAQWPQSFATTGTLGTAKPYAIDTLTLPAQTPWRSLWHFGGLDFFPNGDAAVCTFEGDVWIVSGIDDQLARLKWKRFAAGLHQPLGLNIVDGKVCVLGRDQITRLHDLNGDAEADFYECYANAYQTPTGGHDFVTGLQHDREGRFYLASGKQGVVRVAPGAKPAEVLASGFRNPDGIGLGPDGEIAVAVQEGDWTPTSMLYEFLPKPGEAAGHYGYGGPKPGPRGHLPPLAYLPRGEDHSSGGQCYVQGDRWGVPAGTLVHFSWGNGTAFLVLRDRLGDVAQGTVIPLPGDFSSGAHRGAFNPRDGQLYAAGMTGWITYAPDEGGLHRMRYTGGTVQVPRATEAHENGVLLRFPEPLNKNTAADGRRFFAQQWNYRYSAAYGSEEFSVRSPDKRGHDPLEITSAHLLDDGRSLFLEIPQLQLANVLHLHCDLPDLLVRDFYLTLHQLRPAFTQFPGYRTIAKAALDPHAGHHMPATSGTAPKPVQWEQGPGGRPVRIRTASGLQFEQKELHVKAGERLSLTLENPDAMPHNWVLVKIGALERVGDLATRLITEPDALARSYVPDSPDVLVHTRVLDPQTATTLHFNAPSQAGRYPYVCTFPGHWVLMRGELVVE
ncbi:MAG: putative heme-binding protein, partial [Chthoniobacter sp.]|nr:putative heme-binding protein [Chthoniobacter sp.]